MSEPAKERFTLDLTEDGESSLMTSMYFSSVPMSSVPENTESNAG